MKELKPSGLFYVPVPMDAERPYVSGTNFLVYFDAKGHRHVTDSKPLDCGWAVIGSVTAEHIDFDPASVVETVTIRTEVLTRAAGYLESKAFRNYLEADQYKHHFYSANSSLRSLLTANDVHFVNPCGQEPDFANYGYDDEDIEAFEDHYEAWQQAESKLVEKILILKPL